MLNKSTGHWVVLLLTLGVGVAALATPEAAYAAGGFTDSLNSVQSFLKVGGQTLVYVAFFVGLVCIFISIYYITQLSKQQRPPGGVGMLITYMLAGALFMGIGWTANSAQQLATGQNNATSQSVNQSDFGM